MSKRKTIRYRVLCPVDSGPWLYVDGEYASHNSGAARRVAKAIGFAADADWPLPPWSKHPSERSLAWYTALCYRIRGEFGAREQTIRVIQETRHAKAKRNRVRHRRHTAADSAPSDASDSAGTRTDDQR